MSKFQMKITEMLCQCACCWILEVYLYSNTIRQGTENGRALSYKMHLHHFPSVIWNTARSTKLDISYNATTFWRWEQELITTIIWIIFTWKIWFFQINKNLNYGKIHKECQQLLILLCVTLCNFVLTLHSIEGLQRCTWVKGRLNAPAPSNAPKVWVMVFYVYII